jgi:hypothetical protein
MHTFVLEAEEGMLQGELEELPGIFSACVNRGRAAPAAVIRLIVRNAGTYRFALEPMQNGIGSPFISVVDGCQPSSTEMSCQVLQEPEIVLQLDRGNAFIAIGDVEARGGRWVLTYQFECGPRDRGCKQ